MQPLSRKSKAQGEGEGKGEGGREGKGEGREGEGVLRSIRRRPMRRRGWIRASSMQMATALCPSSAWGLCQGKQEKEKEKEKEREREKESLRVVRCLKECK